MSDTSEARILANSLKSHLGISSGPEALEGLSTFSLLKTDNEVVMAASLLEA